MERIRWFADLKVTDALIAGGKGANLGELTSAGLPVPPGFVVTADAYLEALERTGVRSKLVDLVAAVSPTDESSVEEAATKARALIETASVPPELKQSSSPRITSSVTTSSWRCARLERPRMPKALRLQE